MDSLKGKKAFVAFLTAGDPNIKKTEEYILTMAQAGADLIEIGIPFSDPIAEGVVIQEADLRSLASGTTTDSVFECVKNVRDKVSIPLVFMTYANPVYTYGKDKFFSKCEEVGIDGIIIPDVPFEEKDEFYDYAKAHNVKLVSMVAPTSDDRIKEIAKESEGFLYVVSSLGVTGMRNNITTDIKSMIEKVKSVTQTPAFVGFGINTPEQAREYYSYADGVIVGSAIVKIIAEKGENASDALYEYVKSMKNA
jgi:tryptophan synthase alpha chain